MVVGHAGKPLAYPRTALTSFVSHSIGDNVGVAALSSGAIRYRFYARCGLDVGKVTVFSVLTVGLGLITLGGLGLRLYPADAESLIGLQRPVVVGVGAMCLFVPVLYVTACAFVRGVVKFRKWTLELPHLPLGLGQIAIGLPLFLVSEYALQGVRAGA